MGRSRTQRPIQGLCETASRMRRGQIKNRLTQRCTVHRSTAPIRTAFCLVPATMVKEPGGR